jgi:hypothetical protein
VNEHGEARAFSSSRPLQHRQIVVGIAERSNGAAADMVLYDSPHVTIAQPRA